MVSKYCNFSPYS